MLALAAAVALFQLGALLPAEHSNPDFLDYRGRPIQPIWLVGMMRHACPDMPDSASVARRLEAPLTEFVGAHAEGQFADSMVALACLRLRIGGSVEPPRHHRFLMNAGSSWPRGALRVAVTQVGRTPGNVPALRALAFSAIAEAYATRADGLDNSLPQLLASAGEELAQAADSGVSDPVVLTSCVHLQIFLGDRSRAFRCALAGASSPGDRTWYLSRIAWLLADARHAEAAKATLRVARLEAGTPADRAEVAYLLLDRHDDPPPSLDPSWIGERLAAMAAMSPNELRSLLLQYQPFLLGWSPSLGVSATPRRTKWPKPAECRSTTTGPVSEAELQVAQLWKHDSRQPTLIAVGRGISRSKAASGRFLLRIIGPDADPALHEARFQLGAVPAVVWSAPLGVESPAVGAWALQVNTRDSAGWGTFGAFTGDSSGRSTRLSDLILTPGGFELQRGVDPTGFRIVPSDAAPERSALNLLAQVRSSTGLDGARLDLTIAGCKSNLYRDRIHVTTGVEVPVGLSEVRRTVGLDDLPAGEYQLRLMLKASDGEVVAMKERSFRIE